MVLVTTAELLSKVAIEGLDIKVITNLKPADRLVLLAGENELIPVEMLTIFGGLKCKTDIKPVDTSDSFAFGFVLGSLCSGDEKTTLLLDKKMPIVTKNVVQVNPFEVPIVKPERVQKKEEKKTARKKETVSDTTAYDVLKMAFLAKMDSSFEAGIENYIDDIAQAIVSASDKSIGLPFQLQLRGITEPFKSALAEVIAKDWEKFRRLANAATEDAEVMEKEHLPRRNRKTKDSRDYIDEDMDR